MLCSLKTPRPDRLLHRRLIALAYSLIALSIALVLFLLYPEYRLLLIFCFILITVFCLSTAVKTLNAAEEAISYGGFANELMKNDFEILRIDNARLDPIIQNDLAQNFFKNQPIIVFLENHLTDEENNRQAFSRLKNALLNLSSDTVTLNLNIRHENDGGFTPESCFEVSIRPIYLKKTDIFSGRFSVKAIKKSCYILWRLKDVSAHRNMEQVFQKERKTLHDFLDYLPVGLYTCRSDYSIEYCNHTFADQLGVSRENLIGRSLKDILAPQAALPPKQSHWNGNLYFINAERQNCEFFITQESFRDNKDIKFHCVALNNIPCDTDLKHNLDKSLDEISWLFDNAPVGIGFIDTAGTILNCNACIAFYFDRETEKIISHNIFDFISDEDRPALMRLFRQETAADGFSRELHIKGTDGDKVAALYLQPMRSLRTGGETPDGFVFYMIDNTRHKKLELQYAQAQKMQAMGQMAGGVAHDFNNLLTAMIGFCDLLLQRHGIGDPSFSDLMQIKQNANRAAGLVRQLLAFSRKQPLKPKLIDVTENFVELSQLLRRVLGEQITLRFNHSSDLGYIRVDPVQFSQVFLNLAVNAKDAMNGSGTLTITTRVENLLQPYQFGADTIKPGEFVVIDVKDTGCGIPLENLNRIFEPFFSTKQNVVGSGTGLGLAMVYGIVRQTEGFIKVESIVGKGTTFSIHLPRFEHNTEEEAPAVPAAKEVITARDGSPILTVQEKTSSPVNLNQKMIFGLNVSALDRSNLSAPDNRGDIRILFVEDEESVRTFAIRALKKKGYDVIGCNSAENALEKLKTDTKFNLLITDMVMPGMSGAELAGIVRNKIPDIKIILASGYSEEIARRELAGSHDFEFMAKPFSLGDLTGKVFNILNQK